jgi:hypothetical protein
MPTILKPPGDQWASPEVTDTSHLCSDPTSANVCQMSANMSRRPWPSLLLEVCARSGLAAIEVAGSRSAPQVRPVRGHRVWTSLS